jgi:hypothetical protein
MTLIKNLGLLVNPKSLWRAAALRLHSSSPPLPNAAAGGTSAGGSGGSTLEASTCLHPPPATTAQCFHFHEPARGQERRVRDRGGAAAPPRARVWICGRAGWREDCGIPAGCAAAAGNWPPSHATTREYAAAGGWPAGDLHIELFNSSTGTTGPQLGYFHGLIYRSIKLYCIC